MYLQCNKSTYSCQIIQLLLLKEAVIVCQKVGRFALRLLENLPANRWRKDFGRYLSLFVVYINIEIGKNRC